MQILPILTILNYQPSLRARNLPPSEIAQPVECQVEANCTTTLGCTASGAIYCRFPLHSHENVHTDTCTSCSKPSSAQHRPTGRVPGGGDLYDNSLMHRLRRYLWSISTPYGRKCTHGHMYRVLETFERPTSPNRSSARWRRLVRQLSDAPPQALSMVDFHSIRSEMCTRTHVPRARNLRAPNIARPVECQVEANCTTTLGCTASGAIYCRFPLHSHENVHTDTCTSCSKPSSAQHRPTGRVPGGGDLYDNSLMHRLRRYLLSISTPLARKCAHGHMYLVLETFERPTSPDRLSARRRRLVRQLSDAPPQALSMVDFHSTRTKMCTRTHVPRARNLRAPNIARPVECQAEATCTTTLGSTASGAIYCRFPLHTHKNVHTDTCTPCSKPSSAQHRPTG